MEALRSVCPILCRIRYAELLTCADQIILRCLVFWLIHQCLRIAFDCSLQVPLIFRCVAQIVMSFSAGWSERNCLDVTLNSSVILPFKLQGVSHCVNRVYVVGVNFQAGLIMCNGFDEMPHKG